VSDELSELRARIAELERRVAVLGEAAKQLRGE